MIRVSKSVETFISDLDCLINGIGITHKIVDIKSSKNEMN